MKNYSCHIDGIKVIESIRHEDERGTFIESYNLKHYREIGISDEFVQDNHVYSKSVGTLRGLHFQEPPFDQAKLVQCIAGRILDVALDIRLGSASYGQHFSIELNASQPTLLYIPAGFAHGYCTLEPNCQVQYKVSNYYAPESEGGVHPLDPSIGIDWATEKFVLSDKDQTLPSLNALKSPFSV